MKLPTFVIDAYTGVRNRAAAAGGVGALLWLGADALEKLPIVVPWWVTLPLVAVAGLAMLVSGNLVDADGDGDIDADDRTIIKREATDAAAEALRNASSRRTITQTVDHPHEDPREIAARVASMQRLGAGPLLLALLLGGCGAAPTAQLVDSRGEYWEMSATFEGEAEARCAEDAPCESSATAPGEFTMRVGTEVCFWGAALCTPVYATATAVLLFEDRGDGMQTYGSGVVCVGGPVFGTIDKLSMVAGLRSAGFRVLAAWIDDEQICVQAQQVRPQ